MTVKKVKGASKKQVIPKDSPGFTATETSLINQLEAKKKVKHEKKNVEGESKVGNMFKKSKTPVAKEEETTAAPLKSIIKKQKKAKSNDKMEVDEEDSSQQKQESKKASGMKKVAVEESEENVNIPGFSAPKKVAAKRKHEAENVNPKKAKKLTGANSEVSKKALKVERKSKENPNRYLLSVKAKKLWEDLRREDTTKDKQLSLSAELFGLIKGHIQEVNEHKFILKLYNSMLI